MQNRIFNNIIYTVTFPRLGLCNLKEYRIRKDLFSFKNLPISLKEKAYDVSSSDVLTSNLFIYILYQKKNIVYYVICLKGTVSRVFRPFLLKTLNLGIFEQVQTVSRTFLFIRRYLPAHSEICDMLSYKRVFWRRNCRTRRPPLINTLKIWKNYSVLNLVLHRLTESNMLIFKIKNYNNTE